MRSKSIQLQSLGCKLIFALKFLSQQRGNNCRSSKGEMFESTTTLLETYVRWDYLTKMRQLSPHTLLAFIYQRRWNISTKMLDVRIFIYVRHIWDYLHWKNKREKEMKREREIWINGDEERSVRKKETKCNKRREVCHAPNRRCRRHHQYLSSLLYRCIPPFPFTLIRNTLLFMEFHLLDYALWDHHKIIVHV